MTSLLKVDEIQDATGKKILQNTGGILQVKFLNNNTQTAIAGATPVNFMSLSITPTSSSSKIYITYDASISYDFGAGHAQSYIYRGSTPLGLAGSPDSSGTYANKIWFIDQTSDNNFGTVAGSFLDSPSTTSSVTYHIAMGTNNTSTMYANRRVLDNTHFCVSSMTLMEISA